MINLLPPQQKREMADEKKWKLTFILCILSLFFMVSLTLVMLAVKINISGEAESREILLASQEKMFKTSEMRLLEDKIKALNGDLAGLAGFYESQRDLSGLLESVFALLPKGVYLTNISLGEATLLSGHSQTRDDLLAFKKELESNKAFDSVDFPLSSWVKSKDIDFAVSFTPLESHLPWDGDGRNNLPSF